MHGGVAPKWVQGSNVTYILQFLKLIFLFSALNSAWGLPLKDVVPELITELFFTITHPTDGFLLVLPKFFSAKLNARLNKDYDLVSFILPTNSSKSFASLKFL